MQEEDRVYGFYEGVGRSTIEGQIVDGRLRFHYKEPTAAGQGWFQIDEGMSSFTGEWRVDGAGSWAPWVGKRILPQVGSNLASHPRSSTGSGRSADQEYSFGGMVGEFLARYKHIAVRHRFFDDEEGLDRWCRELLYFPEPAVVVVASHGTPEGINVGGHTINSRLVIDYLRHAENLKLLHFSSCLVLKEDQPGDFHKRIQQAAPFPISGYTTSVDWGGSAVLEFTYLDMILGKGLPPEEAAQQLLKMIRFAGDDPLPGAPYLPAGFRFFAPDAAEPIGGPTEPPPGDPTGIYMA